jgi:hypothetical protein
VTGGGVMVKVTMHPGWSCCSWRSSQARRWAGKSAAILAGYPDIPVIA